MRISQKFNNDYFNIWKELPLLALLHTLKHNEEAKDSGRILIVTPCLIGEFAAACPAIADFIFRNPNKSVDLLVTAPVKSLAVRIRNVGRVFVTQSVYQRPQEETLQRQAFGVYEKVIVLRISPAAYALLKNLRVWEIKTIFISLLQYGVHLAQQQLRGQKPKHWKTFNFEALGGVEHDIPYQHIFNFQDNDYKTTALLNKPSPSTKIILIHTHTHWAMKNWSRDNWVELLSSIHRAHNVQFVFVGNETEEDDYNYISNRLPFPTQSLVGKTTIRDLAATLQRADFFIGIDSGPANLAHLFDVRSITLFGPGPHMYLPTHPKDIALDKTNGRGLYQLFFSTQQSFIQKITVPEVYGAFVQLFSSHRESVDNVLTQDTFSFGTIK